MHPVRRSAVRLPKFLRRRPRTELELENADLKRRLALTGLLVWYFNTTRRPCNCNCHLPKPKARHRWKTLHAPTEVFTRR